MTARSIASGRPKGATAASQTGDEAPTAGGLLAGRVAVVTGGGAGLGRELALGLADYGARVGVLGPSGQEASVAEALRRVGVAAVGVTGELGTRAQASRSLAEVADTLGPIDVVVHALVDPAALVASPLAETNEESWEQRRCVTGAAGSSSSRRRGRCPALAAWCRT